MAAACHSRDLLEISRSTASGCRSTARVACAAETKERAAGKTAWLLPETVRGSIACLLFLRSARVGGQLVPSAAATNAARTASSTSGHVTTWRGNDHCFRHHGRKSCTRRAPRRLLLHCACACRDISVAAMAMATPWRCANLLHHGLWDNLERHRMLLTGNCEQRAPAHRYALQRSSGARPGQHAASDAGVCTAHGWLLYSRGSARRSCVSPAAGLQVCVPKFQI